METLPEEVNVAPTLSRHAKRKLETERTIAGLQERIKELEKEREAERKVATLETANQEITRELSKAKRTIKEHENLKLESGPNRTSYLLEPHQLIDSTLRSMHETLKKFQLPTGYGYGMPASEESLAAEAFIRRNSYWPNSIARPAKLVRKSPTQEEFDRMAVRASAAEKRLKSAP